MKTALYVTLFIMAGIFSCKKDSNSPAPPAGPPSRYQLLTSHYWKSGNYTAVIYTDINGDGVIDTTYSNGGPDSCSADDRTYLFTNGTMVRNYGSIDCNFLSDTTTWTLVNNDTQLLIDSVYSDIISLSSTEFIHRDIHYLFSPDATIILTQTYTYP